MIKKLYLYDSYDIDFTLTEFNLFLKENHRVKLILFNHSDFFNQFGKNLEIKFWTECFSNREIEELYTVSYGVLNSYPDYENTLLNKVKKVFHHEIAYALTQNLAFKKLEEDLSGASICYFLPNFMEQNGTTLYERFSSKNTFYKIINFVLIELASYLKLLNRRLLLRLSNSGQKQIDVKYISSAFFSYGVKPFIKYYIRVLYLYVGQPFIFSIAVLIFLVPAKLKISIIHIKYLLSRVFNKNSKVVFVTVEDSGSGVNLNPCLAIVDNLKKLGAYPILITPKPFKSNPLNVDIVYTGLRSESFFFFNSKAVESLTFLNSHRKKNIEFNALDSWLRFNFLQKWKYINQAEMCFGVVLKKFRKYTANSILTIYEALPISVITGSMAKEAGLTWVGFFPILLGRKPDTYYFPADKHLLYGMQLQDLMVDAGVPLDSCVVTGTPTYDHFLIDDSIKDMGLSPEILNLASSGKRVVVVLTEAFPDKFTELGPILEMLCKSESFMVVLKLHPADNKEPFEEYLTTHNLIHKVKVILKCDLIELFSITSLLVGTISNVIISAAVCKVPALICDFSGKTKVIDFNAEGICAGCFQVSQLENILGFLLSMTDAELRQYYKEKYWAISRFNGNNDGKSAERISHQLLN